MLLQPEEGLGCAVAAECTGYGFVGVDDVTVEAGCGQPVGAEGAKAGDHLHGETVCPVGAGVGNHPDFHADQFSGCIHAAAEAQPLRMACAGGAKLHLARVFELDRAASCYGEMGAQVFDEHLLLAAEAAADARFHDADAADGQAEQGGDHAADVEGDLGTGADDEAVVFIPVGDDDVGLDAGLLHLMNAVFAFEDKVGRFERGIDVVMVHEQFDGNVAFGVVNHLGVIFVVNHGRAGLHRFFRREGRGQLFVFDFDAFQRFLYKLRCFGGHGGHPVADVADFRIEADLVVGGRLGIALAAAGVDDAGQVGVGLDGMDAGQCQGVGGIDGKDAGMGDGAGEEAAIEHTGQLDIVGKYGATFGQFDGVHLRFGLVDDLGARGRDGHGDDAGLCLRVGPAVVPAV